MGKRIWTDTETTVYKFSRRIHTVKVRTSTPKPAHIRAAGASCSLHYFNGINKSSSLRCIWPSCATIEAETVSVLRFRPLRAACVCRPLMYLLSARSRTESSERTRGAQAVEMLGEARRGVTMTKSARRMPPLMLRDNEGERGRRHLSCQSRCHGRGSA